MTPDNWLDLGFIALIVVMAFLAIRLILDKLDKVPVVPTRRVLKRYPATDAEGGEIIELECGHELRLIHHHAAEFPCEECKAKGGDR